MRAPTGRRSRSGCCAAAPSKVSRSTRISKRAGECTMTVVAERPAAVSVIKLHPVIGAEIRGVDLSKPLDDATAQAIRNAWYDHTVLVFRDQKISEDDQRRFASLFGPVAKRVPPRPGAVGADTALEWDDMLL